MSSSPARAPGSNPLSRADIGGFVAWIAAGAALAAATASLFGRLDWRLSLFAHFRLHMAAGCLGLLAATVHRGRRGPALLAAAALGANLGDMLVRAARRPAPSRAAGIGAEVVLISFNLLRRNPHKGRALAWLRAQRADVVVLIEADEEWRAALGELADLYPARATGPDHEGARLLVLSRHPLRRLEAVDIDDQGLLAVEVLMPRLRFTLFAVHPEHELGRRSLRPRRVYLRRLAERVRRVEGPVAVAGDVNSSPWSAAFSGFLGRSGLYAPLLRGGTFPAALSWAGLPIDHVFVGNGLTLAAIESGPDLGSDHRPVIARLRA